MILLWNAENADCYDFHGLFVNRHLDLNLVLLWNADDPHFYDFTDSL